MVWNHFGESSQLPSRSSMNAVVTATGLIFIAIGAYLPWSKSNPDYTGNALKLIPQIQTGFSLWDLIALLAIIFVLIAIVIWRFSKVTGVVLLLSGVGVVVLPSIQVISSFVDPNPVYIAAMGAVFTIIGGVCLSLIGARILYREYRGRFHSPSRTETKRHP